MAYSYLVCYRGRADDPAAFVRYYRDAHLPLVRRFPGVRSVELHVGADADAPFLLVLRLIFATREDLDAALASPERQRAKEDMRNFPPFSGETWRQVSRVENDETPR